MPTIPRDASFDGSVSLLREGYDFIRNRCERLGSDVFRVRLLMQDTICMTGEDAARLFYDDRRLQRAHAAPRMLQKTLFGQGGVQGLDGAAHRQRKGLFLALLDEQGVAEMVRLGNAEWSAAIDDWQNRERIVLLQEVQLLLTRAACRWAAVPLAPDEAQQRCEQLAAMIDGAGGVAARHWQARRARKAAEDWAAGLIQQVRDGTLNVAADQPLAVVARHAELNGRLMELKIAAVELLNLLRPIVAVSRFVVYAVEELLTHPQWRKRLQESDALLEPFAQEVRRLYAFFPFVAARVKQDFEIVTLDKDGKEAATLRAPSMERNAADQTSTIVRPLFLLPDAEGRHWQLRADTGWVSPKGEELRLRGNVAGDSPQDGSTPPTTFRTTALDVFPERSLARTAEPVTMARPGLRQSGVGFEADLKSRQYSLLSQVKTRYEPNAARQAR